MLSVVLLMLALIVQMVVSANGHHKVPFVDLIVDGKVGWRVSPSPTPRSLPVCTVHALSCVAGSMQACLCCNNGVQKTIDAVFPLVSFDSPLRHSVLHGCRKRTRTECGACASCLRGRPEPQGLQLLLTTKMLPRLQRRRNCCRRRRQAPQRGKLPHLPELVLPHQAQPLQVTTAAPLNIYLNISTMYT